MIWLRNANAGERWVGMARVLRQLDGKAFFGLPEVLTFMGGEFQQSSM